MSVTAVILSARPVDVQIPGVTVLPWVSQFQDAAGLYAARLAATRAVQTEWFFHLDDDDALPGDFGDVLGECLRARAPLAFTNELLHLLDGRQALRRPGPYRRSIFRERFTHLHHLVVCRTDAAHAAMARIPQAGQWGFEPMLFAEVARGGAHWVERVGYVWRQRLGSFGRRTDVTAAMARAAQWINRRP